MPLRELLSGELRNAGVSLASDVESKLVVYLEELERWNRAVNLTSLHGISLVRRLVVEPLWIGHQLQISGILADVGSGNGSPAIPLCLALPVNRAHLIEARARRVAFLRHAVNILKLKHLKVDHCRLEEMEPVEQAVDWITLQAVRPTAKIFKAMKLLASTTTRVVWITSTSLPPATAATSFSVPGGNTRVWVFGLDQF